MKKSMIAVLLALSVAACAGAPTAQQPLDSAPHAENETPRTTRHPGRLPAEVIREIVRSGFDDMRACYHAGLEKNPKLTGTIKTRFVIGLDGTVVVKGDPESDIPDVEVRDCVRSVFRSMQFPKPDGGVITVTYPIRFDPGDVSSSGKLPSTTEVGPSRGRFDQHTELAAMNELCADTLCRPDFKIKFIGLDCTNAAFCSLGLFILTDMPTRPNIAIGRFGEPKVRGLIMNVVPPEDCDPSRAGLQGSSCIGVGAACVIEGLPRVSSGTHFSDPVKLCIGAIEDLVRL